MAPLVLIEGDQVAQGAVSGGDWGPSAQVSLA
jgi:hypothetical protein